ncbi:hypothetical protein ACNFR7_34205 [Streptomyces sp. RM1]|uniref:hypothetical protein n=1 Tax=Streptomyces misionensis TaxID=67331 RepID=UPI003BAE6250
MRERALRVALDRGDDADTAEATAQAAVVVAARTRRFRAGAVPGRAAAPPPRQPRDLIPLSRALSSPVLSALRERSRAAQAESSHRD